MNNATVSSALTRWFTEQSALSERREAQLLLRPARTNIVRVQSNGRFHTVSPRSSTLSARRKCPETFDTRAAVKLPALNGRSVRQLRHLRAVKSLRRIVVSLTAGVAVMVAAGLALPAYASVAEQLPAPQIFSVAAAAEIAIIERDSYTVTAPPPVQWPTVQHSKISDGFGPRVPPCDGCSSFHEGVDFEAGGGAEVHAIAAGTVIETDSPFNSSLGNHVTIQHLIGGQVITSLYGHLQTGSMPLRVGDTVHVGQVIGLVGSTGASTGPHLHLEIRVDGAHVNPLVWLSAHAG